MSSVGQEHPGQGRAGVFPARQAGFTLIELLVVVGIIALISGGLAYALRDTGGNALATAQTTLSTLVSTARAQSAVNQTETRLMVYATRPPAADAAEKFLRLLQVFRAEPQGSQTWVPVGPAVYLPQGVYVVPPVVTGLLAAGVVWPSNPPLLSTLANPVNPNQPAGTPFGNSTAYFIEFRADGTVTQMGTQAYIRLLASTAARSANGLPQFNNAAAVRGLMIRPSGGVTFVNDQNSF